MIEYTGNHRKAYDLNAIVQEKYKAIHSSIKIPTELDLEQKVFRNFNMINTLDDKAFFKEFCVKNGLPTLPYFTEEVSEPGQYVVKPKIGSGSVGVKYIKVVDAQRYQLPENYIAERRAFGPTFGAGVIVRDGHITSQMVWKRLRTFPPSGGPSVLSKRVDSAKITQLVDEFMACLSVEKPTGCFMLEFIQENDNIFFLEINPRIWGSVSLMECGGYNFTQELLAALWDCEIEILNEQKFRNIKYFCNPMFYPWCIFNKSKETFFSGFTSRSFAESINYLVKFLKIANVFKLFAKLK